MSEHLKKLLPHTVPFEARLSYYQANCQPFDTLCKDVEKTLGMLNA
jgi:hypothetical protein